MSRGDHYKTAWQGKAHRVERSWGHEIVAGSISSVMMKSLHLDQGKSTSLKYYTQKNEVLYVRTGRVIIEYDSEKYLWQECKERKLKQKSLEAGDVFFVQSCCPYRITAIVDSEIFEIGDCSRDKPVKIDIDKEM